MAAYHFGIWRRDLRVVLLRKVLRIPYSLLYRRIRNRYGIELHYAGSFGRRLQLSAQGGIIIFNRVRLGDDCRIGAGVTIGKALRGERGFPTIGHRVVIGPGAVLVGRIVVGDDAIVGPNTVVMTNVPARGVVLSTPAVLHGGGTNGASSPTARSGVPAFGQDSIASLRRQLREDWVAHGRAWLHPGLHALVGHRLEGARLPDGLLRRGCHVLGRLLRRRALRAHQIQLAPSATIGRRLRIDAQGRIAVSESATIGNDCDISNNVTIGWQMGADAPAPTIIGHRASFAPGAVILTGVSIGDDVRVGFNAVVSADIPGAVRVTAPPVKTLRPVVPAHSRVRRAAARSEARTDG